MTPTSRVGRRYAAALFNVARRQAIVSEVQQDLQDAAAFLELYPDAMKALMVPRVPVERKKAALAALVGTRLRHDLSRRFLNTLLEHGREASISEAAAAFAQLADEANNIVTASVRVATPLDEDQKARLKARLDRLTGKNTRLEIATDASLVGGLVVRIGDTVMDGSVRGYLEQFANQMAAAPLGRIPLESIPAG